MDAKTIENSKKELKEGLDKVVDFIEKNVDFDEIGDKAKAEIKELKAKLDEIDTKDFIEKATAEITDTADYFKKKAESFDEDKVKANVKEGYTVIKDGLKDIKENLEKIGKDKE